MLTKTVLSAALVAGALIASAGVSSAMPIAAKPTVAPAPVETVGWRCGPHRHMDRRGYCVPNRPVVYPRVVPEVRVWHRPYWAYHHWHPGYWGR